MARSLDDWQGRVERHFQDLSKERAQTGLGVFAIEHGLLDDEIEEIAGGLRSELKRGARLSRHWLLWVIYSTEHGYQYKGDEYWPSFEAQTPSWDGRHRSQLSQWFGRFLKTYNGVVPSGRWADHFSIISRPITHAILPKYLQLQFAKELYHQRRSLGVLASIDPGYVGRRFAGNAHHSSARFQEFLQQEELAGRIVLGLLGEWPEESTEPIYPPTLERIVADLEETRNAREWLGEARKYVKDRFVGIAGGLPGGGGGIRQGEGHAREESAPDVRPKICFGHRGRGKWIVWAEAPSFKEVCALSGDIRAFVRGTRCRLSGADDYKPGGWLLYGNRKGVLKRWPGPAEPMIQFEGSEPRLDNILQTSCQMSGGPIWLFRIGEDGTAREIVGGNLRPGSRYIIVSTEEQVDLKFGMRSLDVDCAGISAYRLDAPDETTADIAEWLSKFSLKVVHTTRVWPAGLPGRSWNGEGLSEWLTTETPIIGMVHDYEVDRYLLSLNGESEVTIEADRPGEPVFVRLPRLQVGKHVLSVKARRSAELGAVISRPEAEGHIELRVREPEPWIPGVASHSGLIGNLEPHDADLETFWRNEASLTVLGPEGRPVSARVRLSDRTGGEILSEEVGGRMELPLRSDVWKGRFGQFLNREKNTWVYLGAASGEVEVSAEELGTLSFRFEHDVPPLRWVLNRDRGDIVVRLVDDTGGEETDLGITFFAMETPILGRRLLPDRMLAGWSVQPPGGLLVARQGAFEDCVVISSGLTGQGFQGLSVDSNFSLLRNANALKSHSLILYSNWHNARRYGPIIQIRWEKIRERYLTAIYEKLCGQNWVQAEEGIRNAPGNKRSLDRLQRSIERKPTGFSAVLRREYEQPTDDSPRDLHWYADLAKRYHVCSDAVLTGFAFSLAREAHRIPQQFGDDFDGLLNAVRENPSVLRGARFLQLANEFART